MTPISVVIPVFNCVDYLLEALQSVIAQGDIVGEIIIVDDGSEFDVAAAIEALEDDRICLIRRENGGIGTARNHGARLAQCSQIAFLDADDLWLDGKLARQQSAMQQHDAAMAYCLMAEFISPELPESDRAQLQARPVGKGINGTTMLVETEMFRASGGFDESLKAAEFIEWYQRAQSTGAGEHMVAEVLARRRLHKRNFTRINRHKRGDYALAAKRMLDMRRSKQQ